jgi:hypothetical protein
MPPGGIYRVSSLSGPEVTLDSTFLITSNASNEYFADANGMLFQDASGSSSILAYASEGAGAATTYGTVSDGLSLGNLEFDNGQLFASATDFGTGTSYLFAVPEPASASLLLLGGFLLATGRRRART